MGHCGLGFCFFLVLTWVMFSSPDYIFLPFFPAFSLTICLLAAMVIIFGAHQLFVEILAEPPQLFIAYYFLEESDRC